MLLYPNPATQTLYIQTDEVIENAVIFNQIGITVKSANNTTELKIDDLVSGMYYIKVYTKKGVATDAFIKQ
jgi:pectate lyase